MQKINSIYVNGNGRAGEIELAQVEELLVDRHTEDMQEIISKVPSWILRWGIMFFFGVLLMTVAISVFVRYPDTIKGGLRLESSGIASPVIATAAGRITKLFVKQGATIKQGQPLATITTLKGTDTEYTLSAPQDGKVGFIAIVQRDAFLKDNEQVFTIHPNNEQFFGTMEISANNINKIKMGQQVLINLRDYPAEEYGQLKGTVSYIADEPGKDGFFSIKVTLNSTGIKRRFVFKSWITGDAEIITENVSLQSRIYKSILKGLQ